MPLRNSCARVAVGTADALIESIGLKKCADDSEAGKDQQDENTASVRHWALL